MRCFGPKIASKYFTPFKALLNAVKHKYFSRAKLTNEQTRGKHTTGTNAASAIERKFDFECRLSTWFGLVKLFPHFPIHFVCTQATGQGERESWEQAKIPRDAIKLYPENFSKRFALHSSAQTPHSTSTHKRTSANTNKVMNDLNTFILASKRINWAHECSDWLKFSRLRPRHKLYTRSTAIFVAAAKRDAIPLRCVQELAWCQARCNAICPKSTLCSS